MRASSWAFIFSLVASATGCGTSLPPLGPSDVEWAAERWPGTTMQDLERDRSLYVAKCGGCHALVLPKKHTADAWPGIIDEMRAEHVPLNQAERDAIVAYVSTASQASRGRTAAQP